jgi:hypothetical protein
MRLAILAAVFFLSACGASDREASEAPTGRRRCDRERIQRAGASFRDKVACAEPPAYPTWQQRRLPRPRVMAPPRRKIPPARPPVTP